GNFGAGVVSSKGLLVDVLFEDVTEHIRVNFVVFAAGCIVEMPRVAIKQIKQVLKRAVGNRNLCVFLFNLMRQEQAAIEIFDCAEYLSSLRRALFLGL